MDVQDTTAVTLTYAIYLLIQNPDKERICVEEARTSTKDPDQLCYCKAVILEALRLYGPVELTGRHLQKPVSLKGAVVAPAGTFAIIPIWSIHRCPHNFPRPETFIPERWAYREEPKGTWETRQESHEYSDIPMGNREAMFAFTAGARSCPGQQFALQEAVIVLSGLLKEFEFSLSASYKLEPIKLGFVQGPKSGMPVTIKKRSA